MSVQIIIDSACDMSKADAEKKGLMFLPLTTRIDETEYQDGVTISPQEFYDKLESCSDLPTTSQITPFAYAQAYRDALRGHDEILVITISGKLSATFQSAVFAAEKDERVFIVDSENVTVGEQILVEYAVRLRDQGLSAKSIAEKLNDAKPHVCILGLVDTLEYLYKVGRLSRAATIAGSFLHIKPVLSVADGALVVLGKARGSRQSNNFLNDAIQKRGGIDFSMPYMLAYSGNDDALLRGYIENSRNIWSDSINELPVCVVGSTIGTHVGPGAIVVAFFTNGVQQG